MTQDNATMDDIDGLNKRMDKMDGMRVESEEELERASQRWKSDVDKKLDALVRFSDTYGDYLKLCLEREKGRKKLRDAVIEKSLGAAIWVLLGFFCMATWSYIKDHLK